MALISINKTTLLFKNSRMILEGFLAVGEENVGIFLLDIMTQNVKINFGSRRMRERYLLACAATSKSPQEAFSYVIKRHNEKTA